MERNDVATFAAFQRIIAKAGYQRVITARTGDAAADAVIADIQPIVAVAALNLLNLKDARDSAHSFKAINQQ